MKKRVRAKRARKLPLIGLVLHRGIAPGSGHPYVVIATLESRNQKTGNMVTVWIVRSDLHPLDERARAKKEGDHTTCFNCPLIVAGCYVEVENAPAGVWNAFQRGRYEEYDREKHDHLISGRRVRWGGYGDPVLIPIGIVWRWSNLLADGWAGYTHQWARKEYQEYREFFMASVHSIAQRDRAWAIGWRTFRDCDSLKAEPMTRGEFNCPASNEQGARMTCQTCCMCDGADRPVGAIQRASVVIERHANAVETKTLRKAIRDGRVSFA